MFAYYRFDLRSTLLFAWMLLPISGCCDNTSAVAGEELHPTLTWRVTADGTYELELVVRNRAAEPLYVFQGEDIYMDSPDGEHLIIELCYPVIHGMSPVQALHKADLAFFRRIDAGESLKRVIRLQPPLKYARAISVKDPTGEAHVQRISERLLANQPTRVTLVQGYIERSVYEHGGMDPSRVAEWQSTVSAGAMLTPQVRTDK